jgi:hypothetical protein
MPLNDGLQTFPTSLPIRAGQTIALDNTNPSDRLGVGPSNQGGAFSFVTPSFVEGVPTPPTEGEAKELAFNAQVVPTPAIASLSETEGSVKGGTKVKLNGVYFGNASAVSFDRVPAKSFIVHSEWWLTAVVPAARKIGPVAVTVTTPGGVATASSTFTYEGCVVPKLKDRKLKGAKKRLRKSECKIGAVRVLGDATASSGRVVRQSPKPGKVLAPDAKVAVSLR